MPWSPRRESPPRLSPEEPLCPPVAYFSMEIALDGAIPTYSGGLGVLAGDTLRAAADLRLPMAAITLLYRRGYFTQELDEQGNQTAHPVQWQPEQFLEPLSLRLAVTVEGREVLLRAWRYEITGLSGHVVPVYLLDTDLEQNSEWDRGITAQLYGGDNHYRLCQEVILGLGGVELVAALEPPTRPTFHMNEGHSALLALGLLEKRMGERGLLAAAEQDIEAVRSQCVFTTHTPVPAGHDQFDWELVRQVLGPERAAALERCDCRANGNLNMTYLGLRFSRYVNGVALRHGEVSRGMFPGYPVDSITNGVHAVTWTSRPFAELYDRHIPEWRMDNQYLRYALDLPLEEIRDAHAHAKRDLLHRVRELSGQEFREDVLTLVFARRAATYKRADMLFSDPDRLREIAREAGPLQIVYAGKAHPADGGGQEMIRSVFRHARDLAGDISVVYLPDYDVSRARDLCAGGDLWLNTPLRPHEASGTSGMKAALNGVPSLSVPDGWWVEGAIEGVTGWSIGDDTREEPDHEAEVQSLYDKLQHVILPLFYGQPEKYAQVMRSAIALNASFFNTQRMVSQYLHSAYRARACAEGV